MTSSQIERDMRKRTMTWHDPARSAAAAGKSTGRAFFDKLLNGELPPPPVMALIGAELEEVDEGRAVFAMDPAEYHYNPIGGVHGGIIATLLDSAVGCAVHSALPDGLAYTTLELKVNYIRGVTIKTGRIRAEGRTVHVGRQSAVADGRVTDAGGKLLATCSTTCLVFPIKTPTANA